MNINLDDIKQKTSTIFMSGSHTQQEWADLLNVSQPSISHYIKGRIPPLEVLVRLCSVLNISLEEFLFSREYKTSTLTTRVAESKSDYYRDEIYDLLTTLPDRLRKPLLIFLRTISHEIKLKE